jgi:hypothetical protein
MPPQSNQAMRSANDICRLLAAVDDVSRWHREQLLLESAPSAELQRIASNLRRIRDKDFARLAVVAVLATGLLDATQLLPTDCDAFIRGFRPADILGDARPPVWPRVAQRIAADLEAYVASRSFSQSGPDGAYRPP